MGQAVYRLIFLTLSESDQVERTRNYLNCDKQADTSTHLRWVSIHSSHHIDNRLSDGNDHSKHCRIKTKKSLYLTWKLRPVGNQRKINHFSGERVVKEYVSQRMFKLKGKLRLLSEIWHWTHKYWALQTHTLRSKRLLKVAGDIENSEGVKILPRQITILLFSKQIST